MAISTDVPMIRGSFMTEDPVFMGLGEARNVTPVMLQFSRTTAAWDPDLPDDTSLARSGTPRRTFAVPMGVGAVPHEVSADSTPLQIWEGTVLEVNRSAGVMQVLLDAKIGQLPRHTGEIELQWVSGQDHDLVRPGAVFYLTLFKRTKRGSIENTQELRFRRRPSWSSTQLKQIEEDAAMLLSKMKTLPTSA